MREPQLIVATGTKGVGKTYKTCQIIQEYLTPDIKIGKKPRKVLIFDVNGEYNNEELIKNGFRFRTKILALKDVEEWSKQSRVEVRRILPVDANGNEVGTEKYSEILGVILHYFRGGMLILEDINKYLVETRDAKIIGALTTNRHRDLDIYIHLQSLAPLTTRMWQNANVIRFHYQMDDVDRYKARIPNYELFKIAQLMVNEKYYKGEERFFCYVMNQLNKIVGSFSKKDFIIACRQYLELHPAKVKSIAQKYGKGYEAKVSAIKELIYELFKRYYGNEKPKPQKDK
jgi:hypothetical protein